MNESSPPTDVIEPAASGRSQCRGCGHRIARGELRFGECLPNPYGDGVMTLWLHLRCAAYRRPQPFLETLDRHAAGIADAPALAAAARFALAHRRIPRLGALQRASSGRARCRCCRTLIDKDTLRLPLVFYQEGVFDSGGFIHLACAPDYFETADLLDVIRHFAPAAEAAELAEAARMLGAGARGPARAGRYQSSATRTV